MSRMRVSGRRHEVLLPFESRQRDLQLDATTRAPPLLPRLRSILKGLVLNSDQI